MVVVVMVAVVREGVNSRGEKKVARAGKGGERTSIIIHVKPPFAATASLNWVIVVRYAATWSAISCWLKPQSAM